MKTAATAARLGVAAAAVLGLAAVVAVVRSAGTPRRDPVAPALGTDARPSIAASPGAGSLEAVPATARQRPAAAGGAILASAVRAQAVVAGVVSGVEALDVHGWRAVLRVDAVLRGDVHLGDVVTLGWEELSSTRQVRFANDQRVLVVLDPLPTQSLWRKRFPERGRPVRIVASNGDAFLPSPDGATLSLLEHYLAMSASARDGAPGALRLAELVRDGHPHVAREALARLDTEETLADLLGVDGAATLLAAARSDTRNPSLRGAVVQLAARHRVPGTRETALALSEPASPVRADAYRALAVLPDGLAAERVADLLTDADPNLRAVGVAAAGADIGPERLVALLRDDPSPAVRLAAGQALLARPGSRIGDVSGLLDDPDAAVRSGIAESIGALGKVAVGPLSAIVDDASERAALAAVLGLSRAGRQGGLALTSIAEAHRYASVRAFARLALGEAPGHSH